MDDMINFLDDKVDECDFSELIELIKKYSIYDYDMSNNHFYFEIKRIGCDIKFDGHYFCVLFFSLNQKIFDNFHDMIEHIRYKLEFMNKYEDLLNTTRDVYDTAKSIGIELPKIARKEDLNGVE